MITFLVCSLSTALKSKKKENSIYYQEWEIEVIRKYYRSAGSNFCHDLMPHRSINSIRHKADLLGVKHRSCTPWAEQELNIVSCGIESGKTVEAIWYELNEHNFARPYFGVKDKAGEIRKELKRQKSLD